MNIEQLIGETTEYDKKLMVEERKSKSWLKSVSAFANGIGGCLIFGIGDDDTIVGLQDAKKDSETISEIIKTKMDPIPKTILEISNVAEKEIIILKVFSGQETPYYYYGDGNRIAYVRVGNESIPADSVALKRLVLRGTNLSYDSVVSQYKFDRYSFTKLRTVYRIQTGNELDKNDFISFELVNEDGYLTNAGALLADESPIRQSRLFCTRWYGLDKASGIMDAIDDKEYSGSLVSLLQNGNEFVKNNSKKRWKKTGSGRIEMPDYPDQAVHEALVNALIHRDYTEIGSEVHIDIYDDRLEIYSPGGMIDGSIVQNLNTDNVASKRRNPVIADIFSRMHFMERRGSGFRKIKSDYRKAFNYHTEIEPVFSSTSSSFFVTLYNLNYNVPIENAVSEEKQHSEDIQTALSDDKQHFEDVETALSAIRDSILVLDVSSISKNNIISLLDEFGLIKPFTRNDIMNQLNITASPASAIIRKLKNFDLIDHVKGKKRGLYRFKPVGK